MMPDRFLPQARTHTRTRVQPSIYTLTHTKARAHVHANTDVRTRTVRTKRFSSYSPVPFSLRANEVYLPLPLFIYAFRKDANTSTLGYVRQWDIKESKTGALTRVESRSEKYQVEALGYVAMCN